MVNTTTTKEFKKVKHTNNNKDCYFESDHNNQKNYIDSELLAVTYFVMEKIQEKNGVTERTVSPKYIFIDAIKKAYDINISLDDLNRSKAHHEKLETLKALELAKLKPTDTTAKADAFIIDNKLFAYITHEMKNKDLKEIETYLLKNPKNDKAKIKNHIAYILDSKEVSEIPTF